MGGLEQRAGGLSDAAEAAEHGAVVEADHVVPHRKRERRRHLHRKGRAPRKIGAVSGRVGGELEHVGGQALRTVEVESVDEGVGGGGEALGVGRAKTTMY